MNRLFSVTPSIIVNPRISLQPSPQGGMADAFIVHAPVKNVGLQVNIIERKKEYQIFNVLFHYANFELTHTFIDKLTAVVVTRLTEIGFLIRENQISESVSYFCDIEEPPDSLLPYHAQRTFPVDCPTDNLVVNSTFQLVELPPLELQTSTKSSFRPNRCWFSVAGLGLTAPGLYSYLNKNYDISQLADNQIPPAATKIRRQLFIIGALLSESEFLGQTYANNRQVATARKRLREDRYVVLREFILPIQLAAIRRYYRRLISEGFLRFGDSEWPNRFFTSSDAVAHYFHHLFTKLVSQVVGEPVKPSFYFVASYRVGSELKPHRDRDQCKYSISILLDHSPEPQDVSSWPIGIQNPNSPEPDHQSINLALGDAFIFFGQEVLHYRTRLREGSSTLWFFFYTPENFDRHPR